MCKLAEFLPKTLWLFMCLQKILLNQMLAIFLHHQIYLQVFPPAYPTWSNIQIEFLSQKEDPLVSPSCMHIAHYTATYQFIIFNVNIVAKGYSYHHPHKHNLPRFDALSFFLPHITLISMIWGMLDVWSGTFAKLFKLSLSLSILLLFL